MEREAVTIRFPADLLAKAKSLKEGEESFNDLVIEAVEQEVRRRKAWAAHQRIIARSEAVKAKTGIQSASTDLIRNLRKGI
jgi:predicted CopG family antitoxin